MAIKWWTFAIPFASLHNSDGTDRQTNIGRTDGHKTHTSHNAMHNEPSTWNWLSQSVATCYELTKPVLHSANVADNICFIDYHLFITSAVFKVPRHPQLRVGRRPCKGPRMDTKILNCLITYQSQTRPKCTLLSQNFFNLTRVAHQKFWVSPLDPQEKSCRRATLTKHCSSHNHDPLLTLLANYNHCRAEISTQRRSILVRPFITMATTAERCLCCLQVSSLKFLALTIFSAAGCADKLVKCSVCLDVKQGGTNHSRCTQRLVILRAQTY